MSNPDPLILSLACALWAIHLYRANRRRLTGEGGSRMRRLLRRGEPAMGGPERPRWSRLAGAAVAVAVASFVLGFTPAQDLLATLTAQKAGLLAVGVIDLGLAGALYLEWWHGHGYHQRWTAISCGLAGLCGVVTYVQWPRMLAQAAKVLPGTAKAAAEASKRMASGKALKG